MLEEYQERKISYSTFVGLFSRWYHKIVKIGAFDIQEPIPELQFPHAFVVLQPWIDAGSAASSTLEELEAHLDASFLGKIRIPGAFYDFTRYRPNVRISQNAHKMEIPNTYLNYARWQYGDDVVFIHMMEPHILGEVYADSVVRVLKFLGVRRYLMLGSMYDVFPHTRPLVVSGIMEGDIKQKLMDLGVEESNYEGPTSISMKISQTAQKMGIETITMVVHLPQYMQLDRDAMGQLRLLELLNSVYGFGIDLSHLREETEQQSARIQTAMEREPYLKKIVKRLEVYYENRGHREEDKQLEISPDIKDYLNELSDNLDWEV